MKVEPMVAERANLKVAAFPSRCTFLAAVAVLLLAPAAANAADPAGSNAAGKSAAVTLEAISGSTVKRVILSAKAAERLGIETGKVGEESLIRKQMVSGLVIVPVDRQSGEKPSGGTFGGFGQAGLAAPTNPGSGAVSSRKVAAVAPATPAVLQQTGVGFAGLGKAIAAPAPQPAPAPASAQAITPILGDAWVLVTLSPGEWERLAKDKPARLLALSTRDKLGSEVLAQPSGILPVEDVKRSMLTLYYMVPGKDHGLTLNSRMRVELQISGNEDKQKIVPYSAVYYDGKGAAWVYVNTKPLTFERQRIGVERVVGDLAVLSDGPPVGTPVVTVGASLLYGSEIFGK
ncbi:MAG: hypothetical protein ABIR56_09620 [Polaromonas sp.]